jgi:hypothetical protein
MDLCRIETFQNRWGLKFSQPTKVWTVNILFSVDYYSSHSGLHCETASRYGRLLSLTAFYTPTS